MNEKNPDPKLEQWIDRELRRLPELQAPPTLMPRVLEEINARAELVWWKQPFAHWPRWFQCLAGTLALAIALSAIVFGVDALQLGFSEVSQAFVAELSLRFGPVLTVIAALGQAGASILANVNPLVWYGATIMLVTGYLVCISIGTVFYRVTFLRN